MDKDINPSKAFLLSLFLGGFGVDRFYIGDVGLGLGKLFTAGGAGVWWLVDLFLIRKAAERKRVRGRGTGA